MNEIEAAEAELARCEARLANVQRLADEQQAADGTHGPSGSHALQLDWARTQVADAKGALYRARRARTA